MRCDLGQTGQMAAGLAGEGKSREHWWGVREEIGRPGELGRRGTLGKAGGVVRSQELGEVLEAWLRTHAGGLSVRWLRSPFEARSVSVLIGLRPLQLQQLWGAHGRQQGLYSKGDPDILPLLRASGKPCQLSSPCLLR